MSNKEIVHDEYMTPFLRFLERIAVYGEPLEYYTYDNVWESITIEDNINVINHQNFKDNRLRINNTGSKD